MSGLAMFFLKYPSLHAFEQQTTAERHNLHHVFGIKELCTDAQMRNILDPVDPDLLRKSLTEQYELLKTLGIFKAYGYYQGHQIVAFDGVEHFRSENVHCDGCLCKKHRDGSVSYSHSMVCAVMVCPGQSEVFVLDMEGVVKQDGEIKNDCERNATGRLLERMGQNHTTEQFIVTGDALYSNGPCIRKLMGNKWHYVLNVKPDSHTTIFSGFQARMNNNAVSSYTKNESGLKHNFRWTNNLPLNDQSADIRVNMIWYEQIDKKGKKTTFTWVTDLEVNKNTVESIANIGRSRWKIENETFNTLKNQGYNFEHNYGHGYKNLSMVLAQLMMLAFLIDQIIQKCNQGFAEIYKAAKTKSKLWENQRALFSTQCFQNFHELFISLGNLFSVKISSA